MASVGGGGEGEVKTKSVNHLNTFTPRKKKSTNFPKFVL